ncbi:MAG: hypothetical protein IPL84_14825 [Chitinophagaceae bacterium]|nr:hypothetical protein [Chitinophagaceae bacterium]
MKIRIKANSIRFRLTRSEVSKLAATGYLEEETNFPENKFIYALEVVKDSAELSASFLHNKMTMLVTESFVKDWPQNEVVGLDASLKVSEDHSLYLLLEKDFVCLDDTTEDQSDNFENPNKTC